MGISPSSPKIYSASEIVETLSNLPYDDSTRVENLKDNDSFKEWTTKINIPVMISLLLKKDEFATVKFKKPHELAYAFTAILYLIEEENNKVVKVQKSEEDEANEKELLNENIFKILDRYLDNTSKFTLMQTGKMIKKSELCNFFMVNCWNFLSNERKKLIVDRVIKEDIKLDTPNTMNVYSMITNRDMDLYPFIQAKSKDIAEKYVFEALLKFEKEEDIELIYSMLQKGLNGVLSCVPPDDNVNKDQSMCQIAISVIPSNPNEKYFSTLKALWKETRRKLYDFIQDNPDDPNTPTGYNIQEAMVMLIKAIASFKTDKSKKILEKFYISDETKITNDSEGDSKQLQSSKSKVTSRKNFDKRRIYWLVEALTSIDDNDCFYLKLMELTAKKGKISLVLLKRIMTYNKHWALTWMCDVGHPIVKPSNDEDLIKIEDTPQKRLKFVLHTIIENNCDNKEELISYYIRSTNNDTCNVVYSFAIKLPENQKIIDSLFWVLENKMHGHVISETLKALYSFNNPELDQKADNIINKRIEENENFDRGGEFSKLIEKKPRLFQKHHHKKVDANVK